MRADSPLPSLHLRAVLERPDKADRSTAVVFTTAGSMVLRRDATGTLFNEQLSLNPQHVRLDRLNKSAPVLNAHASHSISDVIGVVVEGSVVLSANEGRARIRFSRRADVEPIWLDVLDKIIRNVSVGYRVHRYQDVPTKANIPIRMAVDWEPFELSLVPIAADPGAQVRRPVALRADDVERCLRLERLRYPPCV